MKLEFMVFIDDTALLRFWSKIRVGAPNECWIWFAPSKNSSGYGSFPHKGKNYVASRFVLMIYTGRNPKGLHAAHSCNNPLCCNPHHLSWQTPLENQQYAVRQGRRYSAVTVEDIELLSRIYAHGDISQTELSRLTGIPPATLWRALKRYNVRHEQPTAA